VCVCGGGGGGGAQREGQRAKGGGGGRVIGEGCLDRGGVILQVQHEDVVALQVRRGEWGAWGARRTRGSCTGLQHQASQPKGSAHACWVFACGGGGGGGGGDALTGKGARGAWKCLKVVWGARG
jgi:hypothetical protein